MKTRAEKLAAGVSPCDIDRVERAQKVYDFAFDLIRTKVPSAPPYLLAAMTRELLLAATGQQ